MNLQQKAEALKAHKTFDKHYCNNCFNAGWVGKKKTVSLAVQELKKKLKFKLCKQFRKQSIPICIGTLCKPCEDINKSFDSVFGVKK